LVQFFDKTTGKTVAVAVIVAAGGVAFVILPAKRVAVDLKRVVDSDIAVWPKLLHLLAEIVRYGGFVFVGYGGGSYAALYAAELK